jgi:hypothetical protein
LDFEGLFKKIFSLLLRICHAGCGHRSFAQVSAELGQVGVSFVRHGGHKDTLNKKKFQDLT